MGHETHNCGDGMSCQDFVRLIQLVLDEEATEEEKALFAKHANDCHPCKEHLDIDKTAFEFIKSKLDKTKMPTDLAEQIRSIVKQNAY